MGLTDLFSPGLLIIKAFETPEREDGGGGSTPSVSGADDPNTFEAPISIDSYNEQLGLIFQKGEGINTSSQEAKFARSRAKKVNFTILLDDTNALNSGFGLGGLLSTTPSVMDRVKKFLKVCYDYDGGIHEPRFLTIEWGEFTLDCRLESLDIKYSVIDQSGTPQRAELSTVFIEDIPEKKRAKKEDNRSPDITHSRMFKAGDSLPQLAKQIYGNSAYYLKLAAFNGINHFRAIKPGVEIQLPPKQILDSQF